MILLSLRRVNSGAEFALSLIVSVRVNNVSCFECELLSSDGLDYSREAEEGSKLCSVLNNPMLSMCLCQARDHLVRPNVALIHSQSGFLVMLGLVANHRNKSLVFYASANSYTSIGHSRRCGVSSIMAPCSCNLLIRIRVCAPAIIGVLRVISLPSCSGLRLSLQIIERLPIEQPAVHHNGTYPTNV